MASPNTATVHPDERQDFYAGCAASGAVPQFMISAIEEMPAEPGPVRRTVIIQVPGGPALHFDGSSGTDWVQPAISAYLAGRFKP